MTAITIWWTLGIMVGFLLGCAYQRRRNTKEKWEKFRKWEEDCKQFVMPVPCPIPLKEVPGEGKWVEMRYSTGETKKVWEPRMIPA